MFLEELYDNALVKPVKGQVANELFAVSGYASATFANRHLKDLQSYKKTRVNLIIGMPGKRTDHLAFLALYKRFPDRFNGYYLTSSPPVHSKTYGWFNQDKPVIGFTGSANYSQSGFLGGTQVNQLVNDDPLQILNFYNSLLPRCISMLDFEFNDGELKQYLASTIGLEGDVPRGDIIWEIPDKRVRISFLDRVMSKPAVPEKSGLNWGQRPEYKREPNQAYLSIKKGSRKEGFLPPVGKTFTLITDDNFVMDCVRAQEGGKAIHSTNDNSEIGKYIRQRIGVPLGGLITIDHLINYGRTDFTIDKLDDETFLFDLSVKKQ